jgi:GNAT superfamily N-acetyltransferase
MLGNQMIDTDSTGTTLAGEAQNISIRPVRGSDYAGWRPLWDGYNAFYGREAETALPESITATTWERFLNPAEPVHALVAVSQDRIVGLVHYLFHRSTTRPTDVCYLQDLFTVNAMRGRGIARRMIGSVYDLARAAGATRVYWQTQVTNSTARVLYDKLASHNGFIVYTHEL